ncbi:phosphohydrolase [Spiribacter vilamensis]|nr:phosphohydrolase [Spiribacter vilamensis]
MILSLTTWIAFAFYALAVAVLLAALRGRLAMQRAEPLALGLAAAAALIHGAHLWFALWTPAGIDLSLFNAVSLLGWLMALMLVVAAVRQPLHSLGLVVYPFAALALILAQALGVPTATTVPVGASVDIHVITSVVAYAILGLASAQALLLAWQEGALRRRRAGPILGFLPPLQGMEALLFQLVASGFVMLSVALISGWLFVDNLFAQDLVHKTVISMTGWLVFAGLLVGRSLAGWRGRTAIRWTLWGFALLAVAYFGSKIVLELILGKAA